MTGIRPVPRQAVVRYPTVSQLVADLETRVRQLFTDVTFGDGPFAGAA
jgi:hypothetical protein